MRCVHLTGPVYRGVDTVQALTPDRCEALKAAGVSWVARYMPRDERRLETPDAHGGDWGGCWTLSRSELDTILQSGLSLLPVQWGPGGHETLTAARGHVVGTDLRAAARWLGLPAGTHLWIDVEGGPAKRAGAKGCKEYIEAAAAAVCLGDVYHCGLYYDVTVPLTPLELYGLRGITSYWVGGNYPRHPARRGAAVEQDPYTRIAGVHCDPDTLRPDRLGDVPGLVAA